MRCNKILSTVIALGFGALVGSSLSPAWVKAIPPVQELAAFVGGTNSKVDDYPLVDGWTVYVSKPDACKALRDIQTGLREGRFKKTSAGCRYTYGKVR